MNQPRPQPAMLPFGVLPVYKRDEVVLWNWFCRMFSGVEDWRRWIADTFSRTLARRTGQELTLVQTYRAQPGSTEWKFNQQEIRLGRGAENDVPLSGASISKNHARLFLQDGTYCAEDLGSLLGSYLNGKKLLANEPSPIRSGDQLVIFPYTFTVKIVPIWEPESNIQLYTGGLTPSSFGDFLRKTPAGFDSFFLAAHPTSHSACVQSDGSFVETVLDRALSPIGVPPATSALAPSSTGVLELLLLAILRNLNKRLAYPFQFALNSIDPESMQHRHGRGIAILVSVRISDASGAFRIFFPYSLLAAMSELVAAGAEIELPANITWAFQISAGTLTLTIDEVRQLEAGDVVLFDSHAQMLLPRNFKKGWNISFTDGNFSTAKLDNSFEGDTTAVVQAPDNEKAGDSVDLESLPVLLHVIVATKEMTLSEANGLAPGTILELKRDLSNIVQLAVNGKIVGHGQLVDIDGKLGVRIGKWGA